MKNKKLYLWINVALAVVAILASSFMLVGSVLKNRSSVLANEIDPKTLNINFQLGKTMREATNLTNDGYTYSNESEYIAQLQNQINDGDFVMLQNHEANLSLVSQTVSYVENVYVGFGAPYNEVITDDQPYGESGRLVNITNIGLTLNGNPIFVPDKISEDANLPGLQGAGIVSYFYDYLDLTNIKDINENKIEETEGLYSYTFEYNYISLNDDGEYVFEEVNSTYTISFYLLSQSRYATSYPTFNDAPTQENKTSQNVLQYFYNFNHAEKPVLTYDASLYNISYSLSKDNTTTSITSNLVINSNNTATLTYRSNNQVLRTKTLHPNLDGEFLEHLELSELGIYEIFIKYNLSSVQTSNGVLVLENTTELAPYDQNAVVVEDGINKNPYVIGRYEKARYNLHVFGAKSYFIKNNQELIFETDTIKSDHSSLVTFAPLENQNNVVRQGYYSELLQSNPEHQSNFPTTNLPPVFFDYFGEFSFTGTIPNSKIYRYATLNDLQNGTNPTVMPATKDTQLQHSGFYEVVLNYTYQNYPLENGNHTQHYQLFVFEITGKTPEIELLTTEQTNHSLSNDLTIANHKYTNKNVYAVWEAQTYFTADITATLTHKNFNNTILNTYNYNQQSGLTNIVHNGKDLTITPIINNQPDGNYELRVFFKDESFVELPYFVDKTPIQNITLSAIEKKASSSDINTSYYIHSNFSNDDLLINQPFTLTYSQKESGAKIKTTYDVIPFVLSDGGVQIDSTQQEFSNYITTNYSIDHQNAVIGKEYDLDYNVLLNGDVPFNNAFVENSSFIYLFEITDQAGNTNQKFVIHDLTTPQVIVDPEPENPYNIVIDDTTITWGTHKAVPVLDSGSLQNANPQFRQLVNQNPDLFKQITVGSTSKYYLLSPINYVNFLSLKNNQNRTYTGSQLATYKSATLLADENPNNFFAGEDSYNYIVRDSSFIPSTTSIANDNSLYGNIEMNLDNSMAILFGKNLTAGQTVYGESLDWYKNSTNADQLRVTYLPGEEDTDYYVESFTYTFYPKSTADFTNITNATQTSYTPQPNEPTSLYPYSATPERINIPLTISDLNISGDTIERVVSDVVNPVSTAGGDYLTEEGFYVFRRTYRQNQDNPEAYEKDSVVRFYTMIVDREQNINIANTIEDSEILDTDIESITNPQRNSIIYQTGSGVYFKFTPNASDNTRMSAREVQQRVNRVGADTNLFFSNKLPVRLSLPSHKYNDSFVLGKAEDSNLNQNYISSVTQQNNAPLYFKVTRHTTDGSDRQDVIINTLNPQATEQTYNSQFVTQEINDITNLINYKFTQEGEYIVELFSTKSAERSLNNQQHQETRYYFRFTIEHSKPVGKMLIQSEQQDSFLELEQKSEDNVSPVQFTSTNSKNLFFTFEENLDPYKAQIDPNNLSVTRTNQNGETSTIYSRVNGNSLYNGITAGDPNPVVFSSETTENGQTKYSLDLSYFVNQPATYDFATYTATIRFIGNENDFITPEGSNFYRNSFSVIIDRIKPQYNLQQLVEKDSGKFNASNKQDLNNSNYFYPITNEFVFKQSVEHGAELDSKEIFIRPIYAPANSFPTDYTPTITPDDPNNPPTFNEYDSDNYFKFNYQEINGQNIINAQDMFTLQTSYYEIVERDEAGNYSVYAVQYTAGEISPQYSISYEATNPEEEALPEHILLNSENRVAEVNGQNLKISEIVSSDFFLQAIITHNNQQTVIYNNPNQTNNFESFINDIQNAIEFTKTPNQNGYSVTITFVNRFSQNYTINYYVAGDVLKLVSRVVDNQRIEVSIPKNNQSTRIVEFYVWKFEDGIWSPNDTDNIKLDGIPTNYLNYDSAGAPITSYINGQSLYVEGKAPYIFTNGEYRFLAIDNFGRYSSGLVLQPYTYEGVGVINNVNTIHYGNNAVVDGITYSAGPVTINYQTRLYEVVVSRIDFSEETNQTVKVDLATSEFASNNIIMQTNNTTGVRTLVFSLPGQNNQRRFEVNLRLTRINHTTTHNFALNKTLPNIELTTLSGSKVDQSNSPFTENIVVTWQNQPLDFSPSVRLEHSFIQDGRAVTKTLNSIQNGYVISESGDYRLYITNALGYTDASKNISFTITTGTVNIYRVETNENNIKTVLQPSPLPATYEEDGIHYYMEQYYLLSKFHPNLNQPNIFRDIVLDTSVPDLQKISIPSFNNQSEIFEIRGRGVLSYVELIYVDEISANQNFINLQISQPVLDENGEVAEMIDLDLVNNFTSNQQFIDIQWDSHNLLVANERPYYGNIIYADYYFNEEFIGTIYSTTQDMHRLRISDAGIHKFRFYDLAGNKLIINNSEQLTINLINGVLFKVDGQDPLQNIIVNDQLTLQVITRNPATNAPLYNWDVELEVKLNGRLIENLTPNITGTNTYRFSTQGYYEVKLSTEISVSGVRTEIESYYNFTIINSKQKQLAFDVPLNYGFEIDQILYQGIEQFIEDKNSLWLSSATNEIGQYVITIKAPVLSLGQYSNNNTDYTPNIESFRYFSFMVDINNEVPEIYASIPYGTSTTKDLVISYNPQIIFNNIGESRILVWLNNRLITPNGIQIHESSPNQLMQDELIEAGEYWIEIVTADGKVVASYKLTKTQPLNSLAIIIISISAIVVTGLTVVFIILRRRVKFR